MKYGSVCSGIEAASVAWEPLGWKPAFFSEIDAFPRAVLKHRFPHVPLHGDFTTIKGDEYGPIDLLVGGTPCQSFSIAGLRGGLDDERGNLALEYLRLADRTRARWLVWENVPGVLSSAGGRDFGSILGGMAELGYGFAYRVLDAQFVRVDGHGRAVPQRRRRVFVVGYLGDWRRAAAVLFDRESLSGNSPPRREAGKGVAPTISARPTGGGGLGTDFDCDGGLICMAHGQANAEVLRDMGPTLTLLHEAPIVAHALRAEGFDASEDGTGRGVPLVPVAWALGSHAGAADGEQTNASHAAGGPVGSNISEELAYSLRAGRNQSVAIAFPERMSATAHASSENLSPALGAKNPTAVATGYAVRRLTPKEAERLQGFPDGWTQVPYRGKPAADGPRYKALGNSMAVNVMRRIGRRIEYVERLMAEADQWAGWAETREGVKG